MFERYTEEAQRAISFARYEAACLDSGSIEPEHLLLGLLRKGKGFANQLVGSSPAAVESLRRDIEGDTKPNERSSSSTNLPLSHPSKLVLAYASDEAERLSNGNVDTEHLLLGILREGKSWAAELLRERGFTLEFVREKAQEFKYSIPQRRLVVVAGLEKWLAQSKASSCSWTMERQNLESGTYRLAFYEASETEETHGNEKEEPSREFSETWQKLDLLTKKLNGAIASHDFEKARSYSEEAHQLRERLRLLRKQFGFVDPPPPAPFLCIEVISDDRLSAIQKRCDDYIAQGVAEVWLLNPAVRRAYTVTKTDGFRECKGDVLRTTGALPEINLKEIFD